MRYFQVKYGFTANDILPIDHTEVEKAIYAHLTNAKVAFKSGSVSGDRIIAVRPDYNRELGWGPDHVLDGHDWRDLDHEGLRDKYENFLALTKEKVQYLMETQQTHLIGKNVKVPELERAHSQPRAGKMLSISETLKALK